MQSTGQTSTQALSFTLMHGSAMMYGIKSSRYRALCDGCVHIPWKPSAFVPESTQCVKLSAELEPFQAVRRPSHWALRRGSSASRNESPNRLNAKTARLIASPGKIAIHGAASANCTAAPRSMSPHAGVGSETPRPRNVSDASARIACPRYAVSRMRYGAITFGNMRRRMIRRCRKPAGRAAQERGREAHQHRGSRAVDEAGEHVATERVGAEPVRRRGPGEHRAVVGRQGIVGRDHVGADADQDVDEHDGRAERAQRTL